MSRLRWVSCYPLLLQMVSVAWLFVFSKFIELTDTVSGQALCWGEAWSLLAGWGLGIGASFSPSHLGCQCFCLVSLPGRSRDYGRSHLQSATALEAVVAVSWGDGAALNAWCSLLWLLLGVLVPDALGSCCRSSLSCGRRMNRSHSCTSSTTLFCLGAGGGEPSLDQVRWKVAGCPAVGKVGLAPANQGRVFGPAGLLGAACTDYCG